MARAQAQEGTRETRCTCSCAGTRRIYPVSVSPPLRPRNHVLGTSSPLSIDVQRREGKNEVGSNGNNLTYLTKDDIHHPYVSRRVKRPVSTSARARTHTRRHPPIDHHPHAPQPAHARTVEVQADRRIRTRSRTGPDQPSKPNPPCLGAKHHQASRRPIVQASLTRLVSTRPVHCRIFGLPSDSLPNPRPVHHADTTLAPLRNPSPASDLPLARHSQTREPASTLLVLRPDRTRQDRQTGRQADRHRPNSNSTSPSFVASTCHSALVPVPAKACT